MALSIFRVLHPRPNEMNKVVSHAERLRFAQEVVNYIILGQDQRY